MQIDAPQAVASLELVATLPARTDTQGSFDAAMDIELLRVLHAVLGGVITSRDSTEGGFYTYARTEGYLKLQFNY